MAEAATTDECEVHGEVMLPGRFQGRRRCTFFVPELGVSEDYGCDPNPIEED